MTNDQAAPYSEIYPAGDEGFFIRFGNDISAQAHERIFACLEILDEKKPDWLIDSIPSYLSILVLYDCLKIQADEVCSWIKQNLHQIPKRPISHHLVEIPVWYSPDVAPDLEDLAKSKQLSIEEFVALHTAPDYLVYMLGFKPGFPFLGGLDRRLWTPRHAAPRLEVAAGSVGIGGKQTGIYPVKSPGGWRIVGRTPLRIFNLTPEARDAASFRPESCFRILPGDTVKFFSIDGDAYRELGGK
ncbi:MAG TPA: 5-oxoprolinase subunit PxpB [Acidobacteriota bacterium]|jgi:inhibitor of KinA